MVCRYRGAPLNRLKLLQDDNFRRFRTPMYLLPIKLTISDTITSRLWQCIEVIWEVVFH